MKDVKEAYKEIEISESEKAKIFNNIMSNRKRKTSWGTIFGFGVLAIASFFFVIFLHNGSNDPTKPGNGGTALLNRNVSLENSYRKEIITGTKKYLEANKIDVEDIKEGEELVIKAEEIVDSEDYNTCKGNLVIKRYNDDFSYSTDVTCEGTDQDLSNKKEYVIYSGILTDVFELKYGIAVASISNVKKPYLDVIDCDANLIVMDNEGNIKFNKTIESVYTNEDSTVRVLDVNQINNKYYLVLEVANDIDFQPNGAGHLRNHYFLMVLDENGKELSYEELLEDGNSIFIDKYIGGNAQEVYYTGYSLDKDTYDATFGIIKISEDNMEIIPYNVQEDTNMKGVARHIVITSFEDGNFYGYKYDKSYSAGTYYSAKTLFKMNSKAEIVWETDLDDNINQVVVADKVYVLAHNGSMARIYTYGVDGQRQGVGDLGDFYNVSDFYVEGTNIIFKGSDKDNNQFFEIYNEKLEMEEKIDIDNSDIKADFEYSFMQYAKLENKKVIAGYTVSKDLVQNTEVLLVFNK